MRAANRVVFNTGITYARAGVTMLITLYSTRLVLNALGSEDYGLYNVIGGLIAMLSFLNVVMATSTQRYISHSLGSGDFGNVKKIFANSLLIHFFVGLIVVLSIEFIGFYLINNKLKISEDRISTALYILHFVSLSTFVTVISVPYEAVMNAHENMSFIAFVSIVESILKLLIAVCLFYIGSDKLLTYGMLMMISTIIVRTIKRVYCRRKYEECHVNLRHEYDKAQIKELTSFASWQLFGSLAALARNQGLAVVLNLFFTTAVNAAYGVANQINAQLMFFSSTMLSAIRPQIMKSEGAQDRDRMIRLALTANKFAFYMFTFFAIPIYFQMPFILKFWLGNVPTYAVEFCRNIILLTMVSQLNQGVITAVQAIGKIKVYQLVVGGILLLTLPLGYMLLKLGYPPQSIVIGGFVLECISTAFRIFNFKYLTGYSIRRYCKEVLWNAFVSMIPTALIVFYAQSYLESSWSGLIITAVISVFFYSIFIFVLGLSANDKKMLTQIIQSITKKFSKSKKYEVKS